MGKCVPVGVGNYKQNTCRCAGGRETLLLFHWWVGGNLFYRKISPPEGEGHSGPLSLKSKDPLPPPGHVIH